MKSVHGFDKNLIHRGMAATIAQLAHDSTSPCNVFLPNDKKLALSQNDSANLHKNSSTIRIELAY
ncbi:hypothetical protein NGY2020029_07630 [Vibrio cholerae]